MLTSFAGDHEALKYAMRELPVIDTVVGYAKQLRRVVQAGGNLGVFPARLSEVFTHVVTFEPDPDNYGHLRRNVDIANVTMFHAALGESHQHVSISKVRRDGKQNHHAGIAHVSGEGEIVMIPLDSMGLTCVDALMLDVEGYELFALRGSVDTIERCRPVISVEINKSLQYVGLTEKDVMQFFADHRYIYVSQRGSDKVFIPSERES